MATKSILFVPVQVCANVIDVTDDHNDDVVVLSKAIAILFLVNILQIITLRGQKNTLNE